MKSPTLVHSLRNVEPPLRQCKEKHLFGLRAGAFCKVEVVGGIAPTLDFGGHTLGHSGQHWDMLQANRTRLSLQTREPRPSRRSDRAYGEPCGLTEADGQLV
jgi:hypothetical protein